MVTFLVAKVRRRRRNRRTRRFVGLPFVRMQRHTEAGQTRAGCPLLNIMRALCGCVPIWRNSASAWQSVGAFEPRPFTVIPGRGKAHSRGHEATNQDNAPAVFPADTSRSVAEQCFKSTKLRSFSILSEALSIVIDVYIRDSAFTQRCRVACHEFVVRAHCRAASPYMFASRDQVRSMAPDLERQQIPYLH